MQKSYYQNILYPLQDKVLRIIEKLPVDFYLTGGTALSRAYLNHRYSDDLDFFVNQSSGFGKQVELIIGSLRSENIKIEIAVTGDSFARILVYQKEDVLKIDFVNDVPYRSGIPVRTGLFSRTDTITNILSNKLTALSRQAAKDVADLVYIALNCSFNWTEIFKEASEKDLWINAVEASKILDSFPVDKLDEIIWINDKPDYKLFEKQLHTLIRDIITGRPNSLANSDLNKA
jgi:predicted nucleotidyltransferase component of viral defense system